MEIAPPLLWGGRYSIKGDSHFTPARIIQPRDNFQRSRARTTTRDAGEENPALIV